MRHMIQLWGSSYFLVLYIIAEGSVLSKSPSGYRTCCDYSKKYFFGGGEGGWACKRHAMELNTKGCSVHTTAMVATVITIFSYWNNHHYGSILKEVCQALSWSTHIKPGIGIFWKLTCFIMLKLDVSSWTLPLLS